MTYINALKYIAAHADILPSPERMRLLCRYIGDPQRQLKFIHIAGSSGKTSCAYMLSSVLSEAGYKVGSLTNTFVNDKKELILINGSQLSHNDFAKQIEKVALMAEKMESDILKASSDTENAEASDTDKRPKITKNLLEGKIPPSPSASEILCAASFLAFFEKNCDICILECGESRADPTGIIDPPLVSVICGNSFTDEQLRTGTGIIRRGTREVVTSAPAGESYSAILQSCVRIGSRLTVPAHAELNITSTSLTSKSFDYRGRNYTVPTSCEYHLINALVTIETVYALRRTGVAIRGDDVSKGIARAKIPLAFEIFSVTPTIILDCPKSGSDVSAFIEALGKSKRFIGEKTTLVISPSFAFDITSELKNSGYDLTEMISPTNLSEIKSLAKKALHMNVDETMLILGDTVFVGSMKNQIQKVLALN